MEITINNTLRYKESRIVVSSVRNFDDFNLFIKIINKSYKRSYSLKGNY